MRRLLFLVLGCTLAGAYPASGAAPDASNPPVLISAPVSLAQCYGPYRCNSYLEAAAALQALPVDQRIAQLRAWASVKRQPGSGPYGENDEQVAILCRMLFEAPPGKTFRRAMLGGPTFVGDRGPGVHRTSAELALQWPDDPVAFADHIPFYVVTSMALGGSPEPVSHYLDYCLTELQWTSWHYTPADLKTLQAAFDKLVKTLGAKQPLSPNEIVSLATQIQPYAPPPLAVTSVENRGANRVMVSIFDPSNPLEKPQRITLGDTLQLRVSGGIRPYNYKLTQRVLLAGTPSVVSAVLTQGTSKVDNHNPFFRETFPIEAAGKTAGTVLAFEFTDTVGNRVVEEIHCLGGQNLEIEPPQSIPAPPSAAGK